MEKVYLFLAEGFEEVEGLTVVDLLRRADMDIKMVSMQESLMVQGSHGITVKADVMFEDVDFEHADMLVLPGGMPGTKHLLEHEALKDKLIEFHKEGKVPGLEYGRQSKTEM